jgi:very-short-patch-repair endonuclease
VLGVRAEMTVTGSVEDRIAQIARMQRGRVARRQLLAAGLSASTVGWLVSRRRLIPCLRGVFALGHTAPVEFDRETEALLAVRDGAALSHFSAAGLWGLCAPGAAVEIVVQEGRSSRMPGVKVHRSRILEGRDVRIRHDLPVVSPARALLDIAPEASDRQLELAFDRGIVERIMRPAELADVLKRAGGHRGRRRIAALLDRQLGGSTMTRSEAEERMLALIRSAKLPEPRVNARLAAYELDFYWPDARFAVEVDGFRYHSSHRAFERDHRKDNDLRRIQIEVMRVTWREIENEPYVLVSGIAQLLARRGL